MKWKYVGLGLVILGVGGPSYFIFLAFERFLSLPVWFELSIFIGCPVLLGIGIFIWDESRRYEQLLNQRIGGKF